MMTQEWQTIIDCLRYLKPDVVNKEQLLTKLDIDYTVNLMVIDTLYQLTILTHEEYIHYLNKLKVREEENLEFLSSIIEKAIDDEDYNPAIHYGFGMNRNISALLKE